MFDPVAPFPLHSIRRILILIPKLYGDFVVGEGKEFLAEEVASLFDPFLLKEFNDGGVPGKEVVPVAPNGVGGIGGKDTIWVTVLVMSQGSCWRGNGRQSRGFLNTTGCSRVFGRL